MAHRVVAAVVAGGVVLKQSKVRIVREASSEDARWLRGHVYGTDSISIVIYCLSLAVR